MASVFWSVDSKWPWVIVFGWGMSQEDCDVGDNILYDAIASS